MLANVEERLRQVESVVRRSWSAKLAPLLHGIIRALRRGEAPLAPAVLRRSIEQHLAFGSVFYTWGGALLAPLPIGLLGGVSLLEDGRTSQAAVLWGVTVLALVGFLLAIARRVYGAMRRIAGCVIVPARVTVIASHGDWSAATVDYVVAGMHCRGNLPSNVPLCCLGEGAVDLLVDPTSPTTFFLRDLYRTTPAHLEPCASPPWPGSP